MTLIPSLISAVFSESFCNFDEIRFSKQKKLMLRLAASQIKVPRES